MDTIFHIKTGGTIGGCVPEYQEIEHLAGIFPDMIDLDKFLAKSLKIYAEYHEVAICHKDSRAISDADRSEMINVIVREHAKGTKRFLITHGTYTMPETGKYLLEHLPADIRDSIQIIITGSMFPWTVLGSDAPINLGAALGILLNTSESRISICMHGKLFDPTKVTKDTENLIFVDAA